MVSITTDDILLSSMFDVLDEHLTTWEMAAAKAAMIEEHDKWIGSSTNDWARPVAAVIGAALKAIADVRA